MLEYQWFTGITGFFKNGCCPAARAHTEQFYRART